MTKRSREEMCKRIKLRIQNIKEMIKLLEDIGRKMGTTIFGAVIVYLKMILKDLEDIHDTFC